MRLNNIHAILAAKTATVALVAVVAAMAGLTSCDGSSAHVHGNIIGAADKPVYLEQVLPGVGATIDTALLNSKGEFAFKVTPPDGQPTIYNLRYAGDMVPLLISPGEKVNVMSLGDLGHGYKVDGSGESELVWQLHSILTDGARSLDSISGLLALSNPEGPRREMLTKEYVDKYYGTKRRQIGFIVGNASSLAAVYALYQRLPGEETLLGGDNDYIYYQMVADSVQKRYPDSRYVAALRKEVASLIAGRDMQNMLSEDFITEVNHPDIELPDMYGDKVRLSSLDGKVVVLDFWSASSVEASVNNAEMKKLWASYSDAGLAIYQVSLDTSKSLWVNAVQEQKLPWTTVCDFRGEASIAAGTYNITSLPTNFVIDREGKIVGKNLYGDELAVKVESLMRD